LSWVLALSSHAGKKERRGGKHRDRRRKTEIQVEFSTLRARARNLMIGGGGAANRGGFQAVRDSCLKVIKACDQGLSKGEGQQKF